MGKSKKIHILFVTSHNSRWVSFEWLCQCLNRDKFSVAFAVISKGESALVHYLQATGIPVYHISYLGAPNKFLNLYKSSIKIAQYCRDHQVDIIHAHFYGACIPSLVGAMLVGKKLRIHTRHYANPGATSSLSWMFRFNVYCINRLSEKIIAPSLEVKKYLVANEGVPEEKVSLIYHGIDLERFENVAGHEVETIRKKYQIRDDGPIVGVVSRFVHMKGVQYIVPAFLRLLEDFPKAQLVLATAQGDYYHEIKSQLGMLPDTSYVEIAFEDNIFALFQTFSIFVHVPIAPDLEAFGQVYVEALAAGVPSVFTRTGIACEDMEHKIHAWMVDFENSDAIYDGMLMLIKDQGLRLKLISQGKELVQRKYGLARMISSLERLYTSEAQQVACK